MVYIAGAGPWSRRLVTLGCAEALGAADAVVFDSLTDPSILELAPSAELFYAGKRAGCHAMEQDEINSLLVRLASEGKTAVRLKGGDPYIFGRGAEEAAALKKHGIKYEVISGVSSSYAVPAAAGIAVTDRTRSSSVHIVTARSGDPDKGLDFKRLAGLDGTLVFMMGKAALGDICRGLIKNGASPSVPCAVISNGTSARMECAAGTLSDIAEKAEKLPAPAVTVVGAAAAAASDIKHRGLLRGKRIILAGKSGVLDGLEAAVPGAEVLRIPIITAEKTRAALPELSSFGCIAFAGAEGVSSFFDALRLDVRSLASVRIAAMGGAAETELKKHGIIPDIVSGVKNAESLCRAIAAAAEPGCGILLPCSAQGGHELARGLLADGFSVERLELYSTEPYTSRAELFRIYEKTADFVIITSGTCAGAYKKFSAGGGAKLIALGRSAADAARKYGLSVSAVSKTPDAKGVAEALAEAARQPDAV